MGINSFGRHDPHALGPKIQRRQHKFLRDLSIPQNHSVVIDIIQEQIQRIDPLDQPLFQIGKGFCREHPRNRVKGPPGDLPLSLPDHRKASALLTHPVIDTLPLQIKLLHRKTSLSQ